MSNVDTSKVPRALVPLKQYVEMSRELVNNLDKARILMSGLHDTEIDQLRQTEGKDFERNIVAPVAKFVQGEAARIESFLDGGPVISPELMMENAAKIQSLAGTLLSLGVKARKFQEAKSNPPVEAKKPKGVQKATKVKVKTVSSKGN